MASSLLSPTFIIGHIRIGSVEGASCVNLGNNWPTNFESHKKHNQGFGTVHGNNNKVSGIRSLLNDSDFLDMFNETGQEIPDWLKETLESSEEDQESPEDEARLSQKR